MSGPAVRPRRNVLRTAALLVGTALASTGCGATADRSGTGEPREESSAATVESGKGAFPVSIKHAFGTYEVDEAPERVVTIGWASEDIAAALDVVPAS
ncbi:hypothetical protein [Streptomyces sp. NPDC002490]|uniref:hypothetical protein n=1 Tax=Streptomyces sp. NPDC002490 TaxID=3154416 RepID=UPI00332588D2